MVNEIVIGDGQTLISVGNLKDSEYPCLMLLRSPTEIGVIGGRSKVYIAGKEIPADEPNMLVRIVFTNRESLKVFQEEVAELSFEEVPDGKT